MSGDPQNAGLWPDADVYWSSDPDEPAPADVDTPFGGGWQKVGLLDGDAGFVQSRNEDKTDFYAWGNVYVATARNHFKQTIAFTALEDNDVTRDLIWPGSPPGFLVVPRPPRGRIAFELRADDKIKRLISKKHAEVETNADINDKEADLTKYELLATIFPDAMVDPPELWIEQTRTGPPPPPPDPLLPTATAWWVAKENSAGNLLDQIGSHDAVGSGVSFTDDGTHHYADMPGASTVFTVADHADFHPGTGPFSFVVVAARTGAPGQDTQLLDKSGDFSGSVWSVYFSNPGGDNQYHARFSDGTDLGEGLVVQALTINSVHHFSVTRDGVTVTAVLDGTSGAPTPIPSPGVDLDNTNDLLFGNYDPSFAGTPFVRLYGIAWFKGTALTAEQTETVATELLAADTV